MFASNLNSGISTTTPQVPGIGVDWIQSHDLILYAHPPHFAGSLTEQKREGVETEELRIMDVDYAQGYGVCTPTPLFGRGTEVVALPRRVAAIG